MGRKHPGRLLVLCCVLVALAPLVGARREGGLPCGVNAVVLAAVVVVAAGPRFLARLATLGRASAAAGPDVGGGSCPTGNP